MKKWEYLLIDSFDRGEGVLLRTQASREALQEYLDELGADGWEIVSVDFVEDDGGRRNFLALAKRSLE